MNWSDVGNAVAKAAPTLGAALGGPAGAAVGVLISQALGVKNTPQDVMSNLQADPNAQLKLIEFQNTHEIELQKIALQVVQTESQDRDSARTHNTENIKSGDTTTTRIAMAIVIGFFITLVGMFYIAVMPGEVTDKDVLVLLLGQLAAKFSTVIDFYFGGSSVEKFKQLAVSKYQEWKNPDL